ncbi:MAG: AmmeMemoRadiSam system protein A [Bacteroidia bacterium]|nr:AmmeMemoRadiSam system protein A [Bacteroidia bacterium]
MISATEQRRLAPDILRTARTVIEARVRGDRTVTPPDVPENIIASGVFVTVRVDGALRGCIGFVEISVPFSIALAEAASRAAMEDTRFEPVERSELPRLRVEVTLLGPLEDIHGPEDIELGKHGIRIDHDGRRGLLLPQVATEHHWTAEEFLSALCRKAYLPLDTWRSGRARLSRFCGIVFREEDVSDIVQSAQDTRTT